MVPEIRRGAPAQLRLEQAAHKILEPDLLIVVVADGKLFAGGGKGAPRIEPRGEDAEIDVGHEHAQHDHTVARFDVTPHLLASEGAFIDAQVKGMMFADD